MLSNAFERIWFILTLIVSGAANIVPDGVYNPSNTQYIYWIETQPFFCECDTCTKSYALHKFGVDIYLPVAASAQG